MFEIYRFFHRSLMQTEKSQPEGKRKMPETRFTKFFPALFADLWVGISGNAYLLKVGLVFEMLYDK